MRVSGISKISPYNCPEEFFSPSLSEGREPAFLFLITVHFYCWGNSRERNFTFPQKDISSFTVIRAERNRQTFSSLKYTSLYEQVNFLLTLSWDTEGRDRLGDFPAGRVSERAETGPTSSSASLMQSRIEWGIEVTFHLAKQEFVVWEQKWDNFSLRQTVQPL